MLTINLAKKITAQNRKALAREQRVLNHQQALDKEVAKVISDAKQLAAESDQLDVMRTLGLDYKVAEAETVQRARDKWAHLPQERIFTKDAIKAICIRYGLRFLPTNRYKGALDEGIAPAIEDLQRANGGNLPTNGWDGTQFYIAAPASSFVLESRPKDPLLFCDLGNNRYYLVHKWGKDLGLWQLIKTTMSRYRWIGTVAFFMGWWVTVAIITHGLANDPIAPWFCAFATSFIPFFVGLFVGMEKDINFFTATNNWDSPFRD